MIITVIKQSPLAWSQWGSSCKTQVVTGHDYSLSRQSGLGLPEGLKLCLPNRLLLLMHVVTSADSFYLWAALCGQARCNLCSRMLVHVPLIDQKIHHRRTESEGVLKFSQRPSSKCYRELMRKLEKHLESAASPYILDAPFFRQPEYAQWGYVPYLQAVTGGFGSHDVPVLLSTWFC